MANEKATPLNDDVLESYTSRNADHHTIVDMNLRTIRFVIVVTIAFAAAFTYAFLLNSEKVVARVVTDDKEVVETRAELFNALFGAVMFAAGKMYEIYTETLIFPTLHTYLHNCSLFPGDEPQRVTSKVKQTAIFWGLKTVVIFMNVGTASLFVNHRVRATPATALSVVHNARHLQEQSVGNGVFAGFLHGKNVPFEASQECDQVQSQWSAADVDYSSIGFHFERKPWSEEVVEQMQSPLRNGKVSLGSFTDLGKSRVKDQELLHLMDLASQSLVKAESLKQSNTTMDMATAELQRELGTRFPSEKETLSAQQFSYASGIRATVLTVELYRQVEAVVCGATRCVAQVNAEPEQHATLQAAGSGVFASSLTRRAVASSNGSQEILSFTFSLLHVPTTAHGFVVSLDKDHSFFTSAASIHTEQPLFSLNSIVLPTSSSRLTTWLPLDTTPSSTATKCSPLIDSFVNHFHVNSLDSVTTPSTLHTAAMLYLTQRLVISQSTSTARRLSTDPNKISLVLSISKYSATATFVGCGIMVLLMLCVVFLPTARVRLSPNTTPAAQYVQILTDDLYPNVVHKKRLRFPNGEALPFNEYVVDGIVLQAKRDSSKRIYLT